VRGAGGNGIIFDGISTATETSGDNHAANIIPRRAVSGIYIFAGIDAIIMAAACSSAAALGHEKSASTPSWFSAASRRATRRNIAVASNIVILSPYSA